MSRQKAKGTAAEVAVLKFLEENDILAVRNPPSGTKDKGDLTILRPKIILEVKNHKRMELAQWVDEAEVERVNANAEIGIVAHKRVGKGNPESWYFTLNGISLVKLLKMLG